MKKTLIILALCFALVCAVSCKPDPEIPVKASLVMGSQTYEFNYVQTSYVEGKGIEVVFTTDPLFEKLFSSTGTSLLFQIPIEMNGKTSVSGTDPFDFGGWCFYWSLYNCGSPVFIDPDLSSGTSLSFDATVEGISVREFSIDFTGETTGGGDFRLYFSGAADVRRVGWSFQF